MAASSHRLDQGGRDLREREWGREERRDGGEGRRERNRRVDEGEVEENVVAVLEVEEDRESDVSKPSEDGREGGS